MKTAFGESAGAQSIGSLLVADSGKAVQKHNLFRGAIMESGVPSGYVTSGELSVYMNCLMSS
jgi:carboxylesterase type B